MVGLHLSVSIVTGRKLGMADNDRRYVRMLASPALYNVGADYMEGDAALVQKRGEFASPHPRSRPDNPLQPISFTRPRSRSKRRV